MKAVKITPEELEVLLLDIGFKQCKKEPDPAFQITLQSTNQEKETITLGASTKLGNDTDWKAKKHLKKFLQTYYGEEVQKSEENS